MNKNLEDLLGISEELTFRAKALGVIKELPAVAVIFSASYFLEHVVNIPTPLGGLTTPENQNLGYHFGIGLGVYGSTCESYHVKGSLALLAASLIPEVYTLTQDGDLSKAGISSAVKVIGYGCGFIGGKLFSFIMDPK